MREQTSEGEAAPRRARGRGHAGVWLSCALCAWGCAGPVVYPRTATVRDEGEISMRVAGNSGRTQASVVVGAGADEPEQTIESDRSEASDELLTGLLLLPGTAEVQPALGIASGVEVGGIVSFRRVGIELRAQLVDERDGAPISLALSAAPSYQSDAGPEGLGLRAGFDLSSDVGTILLSGLYLSHGPYYYEFGDDTRVRMTSFTEDGAFIIERDETRLSVPLGIAVPIRRRSFALLLGVVPEWTLDSEVTQARCNSQQFCRSDDVDGNPLSRPIIEFTQGFTIFVTLGIEVGTLDPPREISDDGWPGAPPPPESPAR